MIKIFQYQIQISLNSYDFYLVCFSLFFIFSPFLTIFFSVFSQFFLRFFSGFLMFFSCFSQVFSHVFLRHVFLRFSHVLLMFFLYFSHVFFSICLGSCHKNGGQEANEQLRDVREGQAGGQWAQNILKCRVADPEWFIPDPERFFPDPNLDSDPNFLF